MKNCIDFGGAGAKIVLSLFERVDKNTLKHKRMFIYFFFFNIRPILYSLGIIM